MYVELVGHYQVHSTVLAFAAALGSRKITTTVRQTRGLDASYACGQLRNKFQKSPLLAEIICSV
ncbi:unnamed protein product [Arabis nemorensis]|uniref:Uncharacterized protein n=1 Tax=Arabis nemorensis TaxID=586526 RepID=A0A565C4W5_9BRAS|nr:unnamed protein product [Arabis nemorensis]